MPSLSRNTAGRYVKKRKLKPIALGELPGRGLTDQQLETVKETTESGVVTRASLTYHGRGVGAVASELGLAALTLRTRLAESRREIVETCTFHLETLDPSTVDDKHKELLAYLAAQPKTERVADEDRETFKEQIKNEMAPLLPYLPRAREGFTREQVAVIQKIIQGLGTGGHGVAPLMGFATEPSIATRLANLNLIIVGKYEYKLEKVEG